MGSYILSLDQGTTSSRAIVFDKHGLMVATAQQEFTQIYPQPGWVEHNAREIWETQLLTAKQALEKAKIAAQDIHAIGITNQRETTVAWDRKTGEPLCHAIVWQDRRTAPFCEALKKQGLASTIQEKTGLVIDAYFSGSKMHWMLEHVPGLKEKALSGSLCLGTIDSWLLFKLTEGRVFKTDASNASRTMLYNIHIHGWDDDLLNIFGIEKSSLPELANSSEHYGDTHLLGGKIPISGIAGDQQSALFGQMCLQPGMVKNTYGTGCFMLMNTGEKAVLSKNQLLTTVAWRLNNTTTYALEGSVFIAGAAIQWLRDELQIISTSAEVETLASQVPDTAGVYMVPAFAGLGTPYWKPHVRGSIFGLTRGANKKHLCRAALESIAYQTSDVLRAMQEDSGIQIKELRVDGGASVNNMLMQFQSDILQTQVVRPTITETTALGAAYLAGLATGFWENTGVLAKQWHQDHAFKPHMAVQDQNKHLKQWEKAVSSAISFD